MAFDIKLLVKNYFEIEFRLLLDSKLLFLKRLNFVKSYRKEKNIAEINFYIQKKTTYIIAEICPAFTFPR
jgi:hypothetical protein